MYYNFLFTRYQQSLFFAVKSCDLISIFILASINETEYNSMTKSKINTRRRHCCKNMNSSRCYRTNKDIYLDMSNLIRNNHHSCVRFLIHRFKKRLRYLPSYSRTLELMVKHEELHSMHVSLRNRECNLSVKILEDLIKLGIKTNSNDAVIYLLNYYPRTMKHIFLQFACFYNNPDIAIYLLTKFDININDSDILCFCIKHKLESVISIILPKLDYQFIQLNTSKIMNYTNNTLKNTLIYSPFNTIEYILLFLTNYPQHKHKLYSWRSIYIFFHTQLNHDTINIIKSFIY